MTGGDRWRLEVFTGDWRCLQPKSSYAPNSNNKKQLVFHSTKKKRQTSSNRWTKPTTDEEMFICNKLSTLDVKFCGVCFEEDDRWMHRQSVHHVGRNVLCAISGCIKNAASWINPFV